VIQKPVVFVLTAADLTAAAVTSSSELAARRYATLPAARGGENLGRLPVCGGVVTAAD